MREDGHIFQGYKPNGQPHFYSPDAYHRVRLNNVFNRAKERAIRDGLPFNLTVDHLSAIFPNDSVCPVSGELMVWGSKDGRNNSPSIDRIVPSRGYTQGNVIFVSLRINRMKQDNTIEDLKRLIEFYEPLIASQLH